MHTKIFQKATRLIDCIAKSSTQSLSLEQAYLITGIPKSTIKRILDDFVELGWLYRRLGDKQYVIIYIPANVNHSKYIFAKACSDILANLYQKTGMPSDLVVVEGGHPTILESSFSLTGIRTAQTRIIGIGISPLVSAAGRALLAERVDIKIDENESTRIDQSFLERLNKEKISGIYRRIPGMWEHHFKPPFELDAVALPIRYRDETVAAINMYWSKENNLTDSVLAKSIGYLQDAKSEIELLVSADEGTYRKILIELRANNPQPDQTVKS